MNPFLTLFHHRSTHSSSRRERGISSGHLEFHKHAATTGIAWAVGVIAITLVGQARAQWVEESYGLTAGWNAVWLSHDPGHTPIDDLLASGTGLSIQEIWRWNPHASPDQFTTSPGQPLQTDTQWSVWKRGAPAETTMTTLVANAAYLVKVADGTGAFTLKLVGRPVPPRYSWKSSGLNFFGFPSAQPETNFETFLSYADEIPAASIFKYTGGPITSNPVEVTIPILEPVKRGQAYWIGSTAYSDYFGPLRLTVDSKGLDFGDTGSVVILRVANVTDLPVTASFALRASHAPAPAGPPIAGQVPLLVRQGIDPQTGQFQYAPVAGPGAGHAVLLAPGQETEVVFAVDRSTLGGSPGDVAQGLLEITDSEGVSRVHLPVRAETTSPSGLWVGSAIVNKVDQIAASNRRLTDIGGNLLFLKPDGTTTSVDTGTPAYEESAGQGIIDTAVTADADAPSAFPLRLLLHRADNGTVRMLQKVFSGEGPGGAPVLSTVEGALDPAKLADARRISTSVLPLDFNESGTGDVGLSGTLQFSVPLGFNVATNPFVHAFHPDHDNKDAQFDDYIAESPESPSIQRVITLTFLSDASVLGISEPGWGSTVLGGTYAETLSGLRAQDITVQGVFVLRRASSIPTLTE